MQPCLTAYATYSLTNYVTASYGLWEWLRKHFSPFMEMVMQLCLTACATYSLTNYVTASYGLWEWLRKHFSPFMEMVTQLCLTACATASYGLWKWLASSSFHLWKRFYKWYERKSAVT